MTTLIIKLGAAGDVIRTTTLLQLLSDEVHWLIHDRNAPLLAGAPLAEVIPWTRRHVLAGRHYDLVVNLEDSAPAGKALALCRYGELFGTYLDRDGQPAYTDSAREWFDLSLISRFGKTRADELKLENRRTYQEMIFSGLGWTFSGQRYFLPAPTPTTPLIGDVALAPRAGLVWPMKNWAYYGELKGWLEQFGLTVNILPTRRSLLEHIADVQNHRYLVSGDSLPMHIALGSGKPCASLFICTSPWEIFGYGLQRRIVSPQLAQYFYRRDHDAAAGHSIAFEAVCDVVADHLGLRPYALQPTRADRERDVATVGG
jgi:heptosyltransferase II